MHADLSNFATEALFLDSNEITATIPTCVGALERLKQFYVFQNRLSGSIPDGLSNLTLLGTYFVKFLVCCCSKYCLT